MWRKTILNQGKANGVFFHFPYFIQQVIIRSIFLGLWNWNWQRMPINRAEIK